ncbi:DUF4358 domain-containing protein [Hydrogenoanaerobacterium sp.]|uniref:DUF4358 domain-containing protein n=1 Tax=Hydrogenoanaerobacterium sp. TaxID=2953763 RepID=UPI00289B7479|nr:DUF4358 domain-containing protein [Hydrogenoanaerobacterium sp.]
MKKTFTTVLAVILAIGAVLSGCGKQAAAEVDVSAVAQALQSGLTFQDEMNEIAESRLGDFYPTIDASTLNGFKMYKGASGATAEEIAVFQAKDAASVKEIETAIQTRLEDLKLQFEDYVPAEVKKITDAVTETSGNVVVLVVADDAAAAQKIVDEQLR